MGLTNRYVAGMVLAAAIVLIGGYKMLPASVRNAAQAEFDLSHSMPRPKSALYSFFFGLEGREIERTEINPYKETKSNTEVAGVRKDVPKIDPKKQAAAKKPVGKPAILPAPKKNEVEVNVVNANNENGLNAGDLAENPNQVAPNYFQQKTANNQTGAAGDSETKDKETLSAAQWRALLGAQPTKENVMKLIAAFNNKEADANTLYLIMNEMMQSSNAETQALGLLIGQNVPSLRSFTIVADNYDRLNGTVKASADAYLLTYMQNSRLGILAMALQSEDNQVVYHAAQVMVKGLEQVKNGQNAGGGTRPNTGRGIVASGSGKTYTPFISILEELVKSGDGSVSGLAQNALTQIQSLSNT